MLCWIGREIAVPLEPSTKFIKSGHKEWNVPSVMVLKKRFKINQNKKAQYHPKIVMQRDKYTCQYCGIQYNQKFLSIDHVIPKSVWKNGNPSLYTNVVTACLRCNSKKADRTPEKAQMKLIKEPKDVTYREAFINELKCNHIRKEWMPYLENYITFTF